MKILALFAALLVVSQAQVGVFTTQAGAGVSSTSDSKATTQGLPIARCFPHCGG